MFKNISAFKTGPGLFRLLLAFMVVVSHTILLFPFGHYAVYVFFMLSGYWIFKMYEEKYSNYQNAYWTYIRSRLMRLVFVYWFVLALAIITFFVTNALLHADSWQRFSLAEILIKNIVILGLNTSPIIFLTPAWSLDVEVQFYLLAPMLVLLRRYINIPAQFILSLVVLGIILDCVPVENRVSHLLLYLPFFLCGALLYYSGKVFSSRSSQLFLLAAVAVVAINLLIPGLRTGFLKKDLPLFGLHQYQDQVNVVLALLTIPFISRNVTQKVTDSNDGMWSSMSFVLYLVHWPVLKMYTTAVTLNSGQHKAIYLALFYIISLVVAYLITTKVDRRFEGIRKKWLSKQEKKTSLAPAISTQAFPSIRLQTK